MQKKEVAAKHRVLQQPLKKYKKGIFSIFFKKNDVFSKFHLTKRKNRGILGTSSDASVAQLVEHHVANVIVAGSIPVTRSIFFALIFRCGRYGTP